jgi:hypothetical protein
LVIWVLFINLLIAFRWAVFGFLNHYSDNGIGNMDAIIDVYNLIKVIQDTILKVILTLYVFFMNEMKLNLTKSNRSERE